MNLILPADLPAIPFPVVAILLVALVALLVGLAVLYSSYEHERHMTQTLESRMKRTYPMAVKRD